MRVTDGNHIDVTVEHQRLAVTGSGQTPDEPPRFAAFHLDTRKAWRGIRISEIDLPPIDVDPPYGPRRPVA